LSIPCLAASQTIDGPYGNRYRLNQLTPDVYTMTWDLVPGAPAIGNSTFIIGAADVILVDSGFSKSAGEVILAALRGITNKPVSTVINTHWHGDHIFGNQVFKAAFPNARFVAHPETRAGIITGEIDYRTANRPKTEARLAELKGKTALTDAEKRDLTRAEWQVDAWQGDYVLPDMLVEGQLTIVQRVSAEAQDAKAGERKVEVRHLGLANTKGDLIIYLPAEKIAITGDIAITPVPFAFFSLPRAWIGTLDKLAAIEATTIVPGHGHPQTDTRFIRDLQAMLRSIVEQVDAGKKAGQDLETLKKTVTLVPPAGSIYATLKGNALDRLFRIPAVESAFNEKE
jgi:glyoxylase-like metal-dependent hydrolase (beta-lactamase superfamily II)